MNDLMNPFGQEPSAQNFDKIKYFDCLAGAYPVMVIRRDQKAGNHQLSYLQAGERRAVLCPYLWPGPRL